MIQTASIRIIVLRTLLCLALLSACTFSLAQTKPMTLYGFTLNQPLILYDCESRQIPDELIEIRAKIPEVIPFIRKEVCFINYLTELEQIGSVSTRRLVLAIPSVQSVPMTSHDIIIAHVNALDTLLELAVFTQGTRVQQHMLDTLIMQFGTPTSLAYAPADNGKNITPGAITAEWLFEDDTAVFFIGEYADTKNGIVTMTSIPMSQQSAAVPLRNSGTPM